MVRAARWFTFLVAGILTLAVPAAVSATGPRPIADSAGDSRGTVGSVVGAEAVPAAPDTTPGGTGETSESAPGRPGAAAENAPSPSEGAVPAHVHRRAVPVLGMLAPGGSSVTEAAWTAEGEPSVLHVVAVGVEPQPVPGLRLRLELMAKWGHDGVPFPSSQGLSSLDAGDFGGLGEAWVEWQALDGVRLKAGRVDGNTEFATVEAASSFANPSFGLSPALGLLPSYPAPAPSVNGFVRPGVGGMEWGGGAYRTGDGGWTVIGQATGSVAGLPVRWTAGAAAQVGQSGVVGAHPPAGYVMVEGVAVGGLSIFAKVASAGDLLHVATGLTSPLPVFAGTRAGIAGSMVSGPRHAPAGDLVAEVFVAVRPVPWLVVQPDLQLRLTPGEPPHAGVLLRVAIER